MEKTYINLQCVNYVVPWFAAGDVFTEERIRFIESLSTENDFLEIIKSDVVPEFSELNFELKYQTQLAIQFLLTVTMPHLHLNDLKSFPVWASKYREFSWLRFWQSMLVPFRVDETMSRRIMELIWDVLFDGQDFRLTCLDEVVIFKDI